MQLFRSSEVSIIYSFCPRKPCSYVIGFKRPAIQSGVHCLYVYRAGLLVCLFLLNTCEDSKVCDHCQYTVVLVIYKTHRAYCVPHEVNRDQRLS